MLDKRKGSASRDTPLNYLVVKREEVKTGLETEAIVHLYHNAAHAHGAVILAGTAFFAALLVIIVVTEQLAKQTVFAKQTFTDALEDPRLFFVLLFLRVFAAAVTFAARTHADVAGKGVSPHAARRAESWNTSHVLGSW